METFAAMAAIFALGAVQRFVYGFDHRWFRNRYDALLRTITDGRSAPTPEPSIAVGSGWYVAAVGAIGSQILCFILWLILADSLAQQAPRLAAHIIAFFTMIGLLGMSLEAVVLHLTYRRLRQAEAD